MNLPKGWKLSGSNPENYEVNLDNEVKHSGKFSACLNSITDKEGFGTFMQVFKAPIEYKGKRLQLTGYVKTENVKKWAGMWMRVDGKDDSQLQFDNMVDRPIINTTDWNQYSIVLDIPEESVAIAFGVLLIETGKIWMDNFELRIVNENVKSTNLKSSIPERPLNLDFEE